MSYYLVDLHCDPVDEWSKNSQFKCGTIEQLGQSSLMCSVLLVLSVTCRCGMGSVTWFDDSVRVNFVPDTYLMLCQGNIYLLFILMYLCFSRVNKKGHAIMKHTFYFRFI